MKWLRKFPRPSYPIAGEFFLGAFLIAWGVDVIVYPGSHLTQISAWHWLRDNGEVRAIAIVAMLLGSIKMLCAYQRWRVAGKFAAGAAMALWLQFAVKTYYAVPNLHPPASAVYFCAAICSLLIVLTEDRD
jgi:hypothetical protein